MNKEINIEIVQDKTGTFPLNALCIGDINLFENIKHKEFLIELLFKLADYPNNKLAGTRIGWYKQDEFLSELSRRNIPYTVIGKKTGTVWWGSRESAICFEVLEKVDLENIPNELWKCLDGSWLFAPGEECYKRLITDSQSFFSKGSFGTSKISTFHTQYAKEYLFMGCTFEDNIFDLVSNTISLQKMEETVMVLSEKINQPINIIAKH